MNSLASIFRGAPVLVVVDDAHATITELGVHDFAPVEPLVERIAGKIHDPNAVQGVANLKDLFTDAGNPVSAAVADDVFFVSTPQAADQTPGEHHLDSRPVLDLTQAQQKAVLDWLLALAPFVAYPCAAAGLFLLIRKPQETNQCRS